MEYIRLSDERGRANFGWLKSQHTFSFGSYFDSEHMGLSSLRVLNDDRVAPGAGFGTHGHRDMEIISYVIKGEIEHRDSMGNHFVIPAGEVQRMSAGTGITHSEYNPSTHQELRFLQIWIQPNRKGIAPNYAQKKIEQHEALTALITPKGEHGTLSINQNASMYRMALNRDEELTLSIDRKRKGYLHILSGDAQIESDIAGNNGISSIELSSGDGIGSARPRKLLIKSRSEFSALWFDLPG
ncbi:pirin-like bicupin family protein [uncultured Microbulbifer sp.]|uniref:pirin family protein n=1 Tax=uncultured Microbulbifer sp. TaxID=348147 RepID=UPI0025DAE30E|nr:pirin-like bicupin family protein [uncultured Microbulbifer sp.]